MAWTKTKLRSGALITLIASSLVLQGCDESLVLTEAARDPADKCMGFYDQIAAARKTDIDQQAQAAVAGALIGALIGAAVAGGDSNDRMRGAMLGAVGGGLVGYSQSYYNQKAERAADQAALLSSVNADAGAERGLITKTGQSTADLRKCRSDQIATLSADVKSGKITKDAARKELAFIKRRVVTDNSLVSAAFNGIGQRVDAYVDVTAVAAQADRVMVASGKAARSATHVAAARRETTSQMNTDTAAKGRVDNQIKALEVLLG